MKLRPYQEEAVAAINPWLAENNGNPLIVLPTATGKSFVMAEYIRRTLEAWPDTRIIVATHVADLVEQNYLEFMGLEPMAPAGIYSAGLKRKEKHAQILFCGIQSVYRHGFKLGKCDLMLIDECHTLSRKADSMWGKFIADLKLTNPEMRIIGLSATPYRMDSGPLVSGEGAIFHGIAYEYGLLQGVKDGFLSNVVAKDMDIKLDVSGVHKRGGEFIESELQEAVDKEHINKAIAADIVQRGANRRTWMVFCAGVDHAKHMAEAIQAHDIGCAVVVGDTPQEERQAIYDCLRKGTLRAVASVGVMTTGTNIRPIDLIADCAPTGSAGLLVQKAGRGMRLSPETDKKDCLYLDYAANLWRHGPLDLIKGKEKAAREGDGIPPMRACPVCSSVMLAAAQECPDCGHVFPPPEPELHRAPVVAPVLSSQIEIERDTWQVQDVSYHIHPAKKPGNPPTMRVVYNCGMQRISEWICIEHPAGSYARNKAFQWWKKRSDSAVPKTVLDALNLASGLKQPAALGVKRPNKYWEIERYIWPELKPQASAKEPEQSQPSDDDFHNLFW